MEKEVKIVPPAGYEVDKENSTFECIKFKPVQPKRWRDSSPLVSGWCLGGYSPLSCGVGKWKDGRLNIFATQKQAKSALAMAQISQIMANDERFGGVITDEEWKDITLGKYVIIRGSNNTIFKDVVIYSWGFLAFHTKEQRDLFLEENKDLVKDYLMID